MAEIVKEIFKVDIGFYVFAESDVVKLGQHFFTRVIIVCAVICIAAFFAGRIV